jgi:hypothetical protein
MFVQSARVVERRHENPTDKLTFYGLEKNATTIRLAKMNLAVHGLEGDIQKSITYYEDPHELRVPGPKARSAIGATRAASVATPQWPQLCAQVPKRQRANAPRRRSPRAGCEHKCSRRSPTAARCGSCRSSRR